MTNSNAILSVKNVKKNVVDQEASIFQLFDNGFSNEKIAERYGLSVGYVKGILKTKWRKSRGISRKYTKNVGGINVLKTKTKTVKLTTTTFDLNKVARISSEDLFIVIEDRKHPILKINQDKIVFWDTKENGSFAKRVIDVNEFKANEYRLSK